MAKISTYQVSSPNYNDIVIGSSVSNSNETKNFRLGDIANLSTVLPVPKVLMVSQIYNEDVKTFPYPETRYSLPYIDRTVSPPINPPIGYADMQNFPMVMCHGFTQGDLGNKDIYCEMLVYQKPVRKNSASYQRLVVSNNYKIAGATNPMPWQSPNFWNRMPNAAGGNLYPPETQCNLYNWTKVTSVSQQIDIRPYLDYRFVLSPVDYTDETGFMDTVQLLCPSSVRRGKNYIPLGKYAYQPIFTTLKIKFRYIVWDSSANNGRGQIIEGPLSETVIVGYAKPVFRPKPRVDGNACVTFNGIGGQNHTLGCAIVKKNY
jgi:hypothetical protein